MDHRIYHNTNQLISLLGYGCMRLPRIDEDKQDIDYNAAQELIDYAYAHGVNYYDTAYRYHEGMSEEFIGHALKKYPRESFFLADKMPIFMIESLSQAKSIFEEQLQKCQVDYFDFYLLHSLMSQESYDNICVNMGVLDYLLEEKKQGRIRHLGFSFHGSTDLMEYLLKQRKWDFVQIQLNYMDWDRQNAKKLYDLLCKHNTQCIVMEPVRGGTLATLCGEAAALFKQASPEASIASWAVRFVASLPNVLTILSGMSTMEQVVDNIGTLSPFVPLKDEDYLTIQKALSIYLNTGTIPCTGCRYCMDCPAGVDIPAVLAMYNKCASQNSIPVSFGDDPDFLKKAKTFLQEYETIPKEHQPSHCVYCEKCMEHCPQKINIPKQIRDIAKLAESLKQNGNLLP